MVARRCANGGSAWETDVIAVLTPNGCMWNDYRKHGQSRNTLHGSE